MTSDSAFIGVCFPVVFQRLGPFSFASVISTRKLLGNLFDLQDLDAQELKEIGGPVRAWAVLRPASIESRFEALHATGLTELVGREEELELLLRRWSRAKTGEGQVVLLSGEAGIGKSRLTAALLGRRNEMAGLLGKKLKTTPGKVSRIQLSNA